MITRPANSVIVLDFETTGLSPNQGDRAIEIGAVKLQNGMVVDTFQALMNPGFKISRFIEDYTGISNELLIDAASCETVMDRFADFIQGSNLVAHNASFDKRFLDAELTLINREYTGEFACSMLIARRLYQQAPNHTLGSLVDFNKIENDGVFHRALADSEMTAKLWLTILEDIHTRYFLANPTFKLLQQISKKSKSNVHAFLQNGSHR
ncbi:3'-5' exonuclease [Shewanella sp. VB17]|uniref:3'-5' exonuclease n=1 Tax=Shewanella sp. VB17 TaxID=2739432 RepID=UPI0015677E14|nr:3'-5' exonuclease [Shewanella sp. VB17]NRD74154.1 3'-5' exonuclease [Shewanella sp. VB17]